MQAFIPKALWGDILDHDAVWLFFYGQGHFGTIGKHWCVHQCPMSWRDVLLPDSMQASTAALATAARLASVGPSFSGKMSKRNVIASAPDGARKEIRSPCAMLVEEPFPTRFPFTNVPNFEWSAMNAPPPERRIF